MGQLFSFLLAISKTLGKGITTPAIIILGSIKCYSWSAMLPFTCLCLKLLFKRFLFTRSGAFETRFQHNVYTEIFFRNLCSSVLPFLWFGSTFFLVREFKTSLFPIIEPRYNPRILNSLSLAAYPRRLHEGPRNYHTLSITFPFAPSFGHIPYSSLSARGRL